jgi:competence protein ComEA
MISLQFVRMNLNREPIRNWFGFTRRERRSSFILLLITIIIILSRYIVPESNIAVKDFTTGISGQEFPSGNLKDTKFQSVSSDPGKISGIAMIKNQIPVKEVQTPISYFNKGGKFKNLSDNKKDYRTNEVKAEKSDQFIEVATDSLGNVRTNSSHKQKTLIDVNSCDSASLLRLPGIGPVLSARIIRYRHLLGGFARTDQLKEVYGLSEETFDLIKDRLFADTLGFKRTNVNSADYKELIHIPYFEKYEVTAILMYRKLKGKITGTAVLVENKLITREKADKVDPYLKFDH